MTLCMMHTQVDLCSIMCVLQVLQIPRDSSKKIIAKTNELVIYFIDAGSIHGENMLDTEVLEYSSTIYQVLIHL